MSVQKNLCQFGLYHVGDCVNLCQFGEGFLLVSPNQRYQAFGSKGLAL
jgi:hypothetical protein